MTQEPWERLPEEPTKAWDAFAAYRDMGSLRSLAKVGRTLGKSTTMAEEWSRRWDWVARARAYDAEQDRIKLHAAKTELESMVRRNVGLASLGQKHLFERMKKMLHQEIKASMIPSWLRALAEMEKSARTSAAYKVELTGKDGGPVEHNLVATMQDAEDSVLRKLGAELANGEKATLPGDADSE